MNAWVLWIDGPQEVEILRVYLEETRAREDFALVESNAHFHLTSVPMIGHSQVYRGIQE
jgi:hypothetical protein